MNVDYGIYTTQGKKKLLGNRATVNGRDAIAYGTHSSSVPVSAITLAGFYPRTLGAAPWSMPRPCLYRYP